MTDTGGYLDDIVRQAEAATGKTKAELLAEAETLEAVEYQVRPTPNREAMKGRRVPEIHIRSVVDLTPDTCEALEQVIAFLAGKQRFLVLSGGVGTRKSGSACWALTQRSGLFIRANELRDLLTSEDEEAKAVKRAIKRCSLLVLDDVGSEYESERGWTTNTIQTLINDRYEACERTIITCNLTAAEFKQRYGERVADRIRESGSFVVVGGVSVRGKP